MRLSVTLFNDPGCPWAYVASPALQVLRWRYGSQLRWELRLVAVAPTPGHYAAWARDPAELARIEADMRRYGMPLAAEPRTRFVPTAPACRAVVAARRIDARLGLATLRALQLAWFTTSEPLDEPGAIAAALERFGGLPGRAVVAALDAEATVAELVADRRLAHRAEGSAAAAQGKTARSDGVERYTTPTLVIGDGRGRTVVAGGFQPVEAYDVLIANLAPELERRPPAATVGELLAGFDGGLTTQEVAALMATGNDPPDRGRAERALDAAAQAGDAVRVPLADGALWLTPGGRSARAGT